MFNVFRLARDELTIQEAYRSRPIKGYSYENYIKGEKKYFLEDLKFSLKLRIQNLTKIIFGSFYMSNNQIALALKLAKNLPLLKWLTFEFDKSGNLTWSKSKNLFPLLASSLDKEIQFNLTLGYFSIIPNKRKPIQFSIPKLDYIFGRIIQNLILEQKLIINSDKKLLWKMKYSSSIGAKYKTNKLEFISQTNEFYFFK